MTARAAPLRRNSAAVSGMESPVAGMEVRTGVGAGATVGASEDAGACVTDGVADGLADGVGAEVAAGVGVGVLWEVWGMTKLPCAVPLVDTMPTV